MVFTMLECHMISVFSEKELLENGGWHHPTKNGKLYIKKGNDVIILDEDEIKQVVSAAGGNFRR